MQAIGQYTKYMAVNQLAGKNFFLKKFFLLTSGCPDLYGTVKCSIADVTCSCHLTTMTSWRKDCLWTKLQVQVWQLVYLETNAKRRHRVINWDFLQTSMFNQCNTFIMKRQLKNKDEFRAEDQMLGTNFKISEYMSNYRHTITNLEIHINK